MEEEKNYIPTITIIVLSVIIVAFGAFYFGKNSDNNQLQNTQTTDQSSQQSEINALKNQVQDLQNTEPKTIVKQVPAPTSNSISDIVSEWEDVIPIVICNFRDYNGNISEASEGSAVLFQSSDGSIRVFTNQHVVSNGTNLANDCEIQFPNDSQIFTAQTSGIGTAPNGADAAQIIISNPNQHLKDLLINSKKRFCPTEPKVGDEVVILGYPAIGAKSGVTATDGIISGYDGNYYVTSAKVDHGNSGGAAIDVNNDCDLGIPTYVISGQLESLARILKWRATAPGASEQKAANDKL